MRRGAYGAGAVLAFLAELAALAALAAAGWAVPGPGAVRVAAAVALPLAAAALWGLFAAPRAAFPHPVTAVVTRTLVQGGAAAALLVLGSAVAASALVAAAVLGEVLTAGRRQGVSRGGRPAGAGPTRSGPAGPREGGRPSA